VTDFTNIVILLGVLGIVLLACAVVVGAVVLKSVGTLKKELLGQREQTDVHVHPNPLTVREETPFATRGELEEHRAEDDQTHSALNAQIQAVDDDLQLLRKEIVTNGETRRISIETKVEAARAEAREHHARLAETLSELAVSQSATTATLAAWKESPPWTPRLK
jgi:hypothetical protein